METSTTEPVTQEILDLFQTYSMIAHLVGVIYLEGKLAEVPYSKELDELLKRTGHRYERRIEAVNFRVEDVPRCLLPETEDASQRCNRCVGTGRHGGQLDSYACQFCAVTDTPGISEDLPRAPIPGDGNDLTPRIEPSDIAQTEFWAYAEFRKANRVAWFCERDRSNFIHGYRAAFATIEGRDGGSDE